MTAGGLFSHIPTNFEITFKTWALVYQRTWQNEVLQDWTGPPKFSGPSGKKCDETLQKTCQILTMLNAHVQFVFVSSL